MPLLKEWAKNGDYEDNPLDHAQAKHCLFHMCIKRGSSPLGFTHGQKCTQMKYICMLSSVNRIGQVRGSLHAVVS